jgi:hypothetical protein
MFNLNTAVEWFGVQIKTKRSCHAAKHRTLVWTDNVAAVLELNTCQYNKAVPFPRTLSPAFGKFIHARPAGIPCNMNRAILFGAQ